MFRAMTTYLSTLLTIGGLALVGVAGHSTHWTFQFAHGDTNHSIAHPESASEEAPASHSIVKLKNKTAAEQSGIVTAAVTRQEMIDEVEANGRIEFSPLHYVRISSRAKGALWRIEKQLGDQVKPDDVLAIIEAPEVGTIKADLLRAKAQLVWRSETVSRFLAVGEAVAEKQLLEARAAEREAHVNLLNAAQLLSNHGADVDLTALDGLTDDQAVEKIRFAGIPEEIRQKLAAPGANSSLVAIKCPLEGIVIGRNGAAGEMIDEGAMLFEVADPRQMVIKMDVRREGASKLALGQKVNFSVDGHAGAGFAEISWIGVEVNEDTQTVEARGNITQFPEGGLKANCFARCRIETTKHSALLISRSALHASEKSFFLFRKRNDLEFEAIRVDRGFENGQMVEVLGDLHEGDVVATEGSHSLWSALVLQKSAE